MFKILGKPLIHYVIDTLKQAGLKDHIIVVGHRGEQIKNYFKDGNNFGVQIKYTSQKSPLGMANALKTVEDLAEDNFFVINADDIFEVSLIKQMIREFKRGEAEIVLSCKPVKETWKYGMIRIENEKVINRLPPLSQEIVQIARQHGKVMVRDALRITGANRNTIKAHIAKLVRSGQLKMVGRGKGAWYKLP